jgi:hypothetical protein
MTKRRPGFFRLFVTGFVLGTAGLVGVQVAQASPESVIPAAHASPR